MTRPESRPAGTALSPTEAGHENVAWPRAERVDLFPTAIRETETVVGMNAASSRNASGDADQPGIRVSQILAAASIASSHAAVVASSWICFAKLGVSTPAIWLIGVSFLRNFKAHSSAVFISLIVCPFVSGF